MRRRKETVKDIEFVYVPRIEDRTEDDLFEHPVPTDIAARLLDAWTRAGVLQKRLNAQGNPMWGEQNRFALHFQSGIPIDFFCAREANWWNLVVCRTGPKESNTAICMAAERRGWKWDPYSPGFLDRLTLEVVRRVRSEREVFEAVGLNYKEPWERK
jgi:DNA polymerase/3'-5' exonuclease PolX